MKLSEFIEEKKEELSKEYREVIFSEAIDVQLSKNSTTESFISTNTPFDKDVIEINLSELKENITAGFNPNGTKVVFGVKLPRKRKFIDKVFYCLYT